ncbi:segregation and condensation protein A [Streptomyces zhihengii]|uniref:segregation and condensation protein A n=1 Tax=Streptomyces zhihengii TaxID=1818004 RepID=UPI003635D9E6
MPPTDETSRPARRRALGRGPGVPAAPGPQGHGAAEAPVSAAAPVPEAEAAPVPDAPVTPAPEAPPAPVGVVVPEAAPEPGVHGSVTTPAPEAAPAQPATTPVPAAREAPAPEAGAPPVPDAPAPAGAPAPQAPPAPVDAAPGEGEGRFRVRLANFEGPFDLLLQLIAKHKMDVTEVALSKVTDEFMAHIRSMGPDWDLDQTTEFLVVAATLLDLKAARLLPAAEVEDEADLALLEARDLLFARLLQYRAYKRIAEIFEGRLDDEARRFPRTVGLEPHHADLLPDVVISIGAEGFARLAVKAMQPKPRPQVYVDHIHAPLVSVREQAEVVVALLRERGTASFRELTEGVDDTLTVVARFLALLELYREKVLVLEQPEALGELTVTWAAGDGAAEVTVTDEFDQVVEEKE